MHFVKCVPIRGATQYKVRKMLDYLNIEILGLYPAMSFSLMYCLM